MIITRSWLQEWIDISKISSDKLKETLNRIGLEVDSYKEIRIPKKVVVGYVKSKKKHENSDKLSICEVDVKDEVLQIVCGAKNVEAGQYVAVSLVGAVLPSGLKIKTTKLRGVESNGMICSSTELGLIKINEGIMILDDSIGKLELGKELSQYPILNDDIIEIDLTPNRGDCLSVYGIARDLSAALDLSLKNVVYNEEDGLGIGRLLGIHSNEKIQSSFQYRAFNVKNSIKLNMLVLIRIHLAEINKENNIESMLAYTTYSTGVLLRAYDAIKLCPACDKITLSIKEEKNENCGVYYDDKCLSIAGISQNDFGKISDDSKVIILEANYTDPKIISVAVNEDKKHKGDNHVYRSARGSEPNLSLGGDYLFNIFSKMDNVDLYNGSQQILPHRDRKIINLDTKEINSIIGQKVDRNEIVKILKKLKFDVAIEQESINIKVPYFRHDIENIHDVTEEIVRIIGIDNIPSKPLSYSETNRLNQSFIEYKNKKEVRYKAIGEGFFETLHYIFDNDKELEELGFKNCKVKIINPINNDLNAFRPTLINNLIKSCERNIKNSRKSVNLFEIGTVFDISSKEKTNIAFLSSGLIGESSLLNGAKPKAIDFLRFASKVQSTIGEFKCEIPKENIEFLNNFEQANIIQNGKNVGYIGRLNLAIEAKYDLPKTYVCEIDFSKLEFNPIIAKPYAKFPTISRDLSLIAPSSMRYEEIRKCLDSIKINNLKSYNIIDIYTDEKMHDQNSLTIKFVFQSMEKTLEDDDINTQIDKILSQLNEKLNIGIR
ncbi:phenylalanyl-tRNA synthetase, beta subunit [Campylobacter blaseri]|uniref:Phenylalanine--tRNA ligase beta subunit n=1 Tax=Campylobacter blaseri TaxID=2042961 RepID=A0A2P8R0A4_9BACT|nr:phenylalanine--tRNA ligase subunit beta [Campylobacter blaseri]PSM51935.1 phenylalanine--tRNA ligase subunit beta [Campylobacter blaseri]PSM53719.1 phenylalanine--tRNA ligase subunit beta [Campylobacter blaseri]QKF85727.1 phenylalanyl-tRNA synthetase, beta subunit [Campylobacter blaseri]